MRGAHVFNVAPGAEQRRLRRRCSSKKAGTRLLFVWAAFRPCEACIVTSAARYRAWRKNLMFSPWLDRAQGESCTPRAKCDSACAAWHAASGCLQCARMSLSSVWTVFGVLLFQRIVV